MPACSEVHTESRQQQRQEVNMDELNSAATEPHVMQESVFANLPP